MPIPQSPPVPMACPDYLPAPLLFGGGRTPALLLLSPSDCQEEIGQIVHSFRYLGMRDILVGNVPGIEISGAYP